MISYDTGVDTDRAARAHEYYHVLCVRDMGPGTFYFGYLFLAIGYGTREAHPLEAGAYAIERIYQANTWLPHPSEVPWQQRWFRGTPVDM